MIPIFQTDVTEYVKNLKKRLMETEKALKQVINSPIWDKSRMHSEYSFAKLNHNQKAIEREHGRGLKSIKAFKVGVSALANLDLDRKNGDLKR